MSAPPDNTDPDALGPGKAGGEVGATGGSAPVGGATSTSFIPEGLHRAPYILVVDDDESIRKLLHFHLRRSGCEVALAEDGPSALKAIEEGRAVDLVLLDLVLPGMSGLDTLRAINRTGKVGCVVLMTAHGTMTDAVAAIKEGAYDFVSKSASFDDVRLAVRNALERLGLREEVEQLRMRLNEHEGGGPSIIGNSKPIHQLLKLVRKVTGSDITVLIHGESGVGKELVARAIHYSGPYRQRPFVALNCAAIPENLLESELFGHERGAFTGATGRRAGRFEEAHEGSLFLDEIGELSMALQAKLLRVLQTGEIQPIGGRSRKVRVRIISATNQDLLRAVREKRFRQDLYYRLAVFPIPVPSLAERREDVPLLVEHFLERFAGQEHKTVRGVSPEALDRLIAHPWHGNVRELENLIYRAVVLSESDWLTLGDFPGLIPIEEEGAGGGGVAGETALLSSPPQSSPAQPALQPEGAAPPHPLSSEAGHGEAGRGEISGRAPASREPGSRAPGSLEALEEAAIREAVARCDGNMTLAARELGIGRATLYRKAEKYGLR